VIEKRESKTKNHVYLLKERSFNIWYLMRYGRKSDKQRVRWYVKFLESWCADSELEERISTFISKIEKSDLTEESIDFFTDVYSSLRKLSLQSKGALKRGVPPKFRNQIELSSLEIATLVSKAVDEKQFHQALVWLSEIEQIEEVHKQLVLAIFVGVTDLDPKTNLKAFFSDVINEWGTGDMILSKTQMTIFVLAFLIMLCALADKMDHVELERIVEAFKAGLILIANLCDYLNAEEFNYSTMGVEIILLCYPLRILNRFSMLEPIIQLFEDDSKFAKGENLNFRTVLNPIYISLKISTGKLAFSQIPPEKEQLIRNIVERITQKD
jgi:hypothetical protein